MVRAGRHGERELEAIEKGFVAIGWDALPDMSKIKNREELLPSTDKPTPIEKR
jgi:predicted Mrr-cat superfamily restriction endonuclease